jgi:restriction endonuclease S subunit
VKKDKLPDGWRISQLKDVCQLVNGDAYKDTDWSNKGIPIIRIQNLNDKTKTFNYWAGSLEKKVNISDGDLLLAWSGTPGTSFGAHIWKRGKALLNQHIFKVIYNKRIISPVWMKYAINQILDVMIERSHGAVGLRHITKSEAENLEILLPPLVEQKRIVSIIETKCKSVEKAKQAAEEQLKAAESLINSYIQNMLAYNKWRNIKLKEICKIERGGSPRPIEAYLTKEKDGINWIKIGDAKINSKYIETTKEKILQSGVSKSRRVKPGDFILSNSMSFGRPYILKIHGCIHDGWLVLGDISKDMDQDFLYILLSSSMVKKQFENSARGAIVKNLNIDIVKEVDIPIPPIDEQHHIVKFFQKKQNSVEKLISSLDEQLTFINFLPAAILRKAFNGEL